jgi:hypothetical protein
MVNENAGSLALVSWGTATLAIFAVDWRLNTGDLPARKRYPDTARISGKFFGKIFRLQ